LVSIILRIKHIFRTLFLNSEFSIISYLFVIYLELFKKKNFVAQLILMKEKIGQFQAYFHSKKPRFLAENNYSKSTTRKITKRNSVFGVPVRFGINIISKSSTGAKSNDLLDHRRSGSKFETLIKNIIVSK